MHEVQCLIHRDFIQVHNSELNFQVIFIVSIWLEGSLRSTEECFNTGVQ